MSGLRQKIVDLKSELVRHFFSEQYCKKSGNLEKYAHTFLELFLFPYLQEHIRTIEEIDEETLVSRVNHASDDEEDLQPVRSD